MNTYEELRTSFERIVNIADNEDLSSIKAMGQVEEVALAALGVRPRNCDVGTAEEQSTRWEKLCESYGGQCSKCNFYTSCDLSAKCFAKWSQMPYKEGEAG